MKGRKRVLFAALSLFTAALMTACGGGGGGGGTTPGVTPGAAVSKGVVTALGSVVVNGITFNTDSATVRIDDNPSTADQLKVGMVVKVRGTSDDATKTGTATLVEAMDALEGTISGVGANTITVMGQTVQIEDNVTRINDDDTVKTFAAGGFAAGQVVEVHGFADDQGGLRATRVAKKQTGEFEIKGFVVSPVTGSFGLSLTPGGASVLTVNFSGTLPAPGAFVEVKSSAAPVAGAITASSVQLEDALGAANEKVEVEGIVASGDVNSFVVNGQQVITNAATLFEGGLKSDFTTGIKVEAEGPLNAAGAIVATKVSFRSSIRIEADVTAFTAGSSLTVLGKAVAINQFTRTDNGPVAVGSHVEVRAFPDRDGNLIATRVVVRNADTRALLQGPVTAANSAAGTLTILGIPITTNAQTEFRVSFDSSEQAVNAATFFAQVKANVTVVKVRWRPFTSTSAAVEQAEIQVGKSLAVAGDSVSLGVVTEKGSVFVNGIRFHTGGAAVMIDGIPGTEDNLKVGMVVKVRGTIDDATQTGTATLVEANDALEGTIQGVSANTITVMGQTVRIEDNVTRLNDDDTVKTFAAAGFAVNQRVEVHGFLDDNGGLRATRVAKKAEGEFEVKGLVKSIGTGTFVLSLPGGDVTVTGTLPTGTIVGSLVEVKANGAPAGGALTATVVQLEDAIGVAGEKVEVEGIVMTGGTAESFTINGQKVVTNTATLFEGGLRADFVEGVKVEAEGPLDANGVIVAVKVSFRSNIKIEADVTAFTADSSLTLLGKTVAINAFTRKDGTLTGIGNHVEVRAFLDRDGNLVASRIVVRSASTRAFLQGPVTAVDSTAGTMTILGVPVTTTGVTEFRVSVDSTDTPVAKADFFAQVKTNVTVVKVRWNTFTATTAAVDQAEIQLGK
ncbi:MAG: hypothetical protein FD174_348 [Geobacteraceae bacterium]|nr:MAG: hypothetical protein FD174_348 [Geobacteraceae bacterium]